MRGEGRELGAVGELVDWTFVVVVVSSLAADPGKGDKIFGLDWLGRLI